MCIEQDVFPQKLKIAKIVIAVQKKGAWGKHGNSGLLVCNLLLDFLSRVKELVV